VQRGGRLNINPIAACEVATEAVDNNRRRQRCLTNRVMISRSLRNVNDQHQNFLAALPSQLITSCKTSTTATSLIPRVATSASDRPRDVIPPLPDDAWPSAKANKSTTDESTKDSRYPADSLALRESRVCARNTICAPGEQT